MLRRPYKQVNSGRTDRLGRFRVGGLPKAPLVLDIGGGGYGYPKGPRLRNVTPGTTGLEVVGRFTFFENPFVLAGTVVDQDGKPVANARVIADRGPLLGPGDETTTNESGSFFLVGLGAGVYELSATVEGAAGRCLTMVGDRKVRIVVSQ